MHWFFIALIGPFLWAVSNHIDKYLIERYFKDRQVGALVIFSSLIGIFILPFVLLIEPNVFRVHPPEALLAILNGVCLMVGLLLYFHALKEDEASVVAPLFQLIPFFLFIFGYLFLGETLTFAQISGALLIMGGSLAISFKFSGTKRKFKRKVFLLMMLSSFVIAASTVLFKKVALQENFWISIFWGWAGSIMTGFFCLFFIPSYHRAFGDILRKNSFAVIAVSCVNEFLDIVATITFRFAGFLAPLALVQAVGGFQYVFVFIFGIILTLFFPMLARESLRKKDLFQKCFAIGIMIIGAVLIGK